MRILVDMNLAPVWRAALVAAGPSVVQVRAQDVLPETLAPLVLRALSAFETELQRGAVLTLEPGRARIRLLPLSSPV